MAPSFEAIGQSATKLNVQKWPLPLRRSVTQQQTDRLTEGRKPVYSGSWTHEVQVFKGVRSRSYAVGFTHSKNVR